MQCKWKIILASILTLSTSISMAGIFDSMLTQSGAFLFDTNRLQLPEETAWFNPDNSDNDFQQIIEINSYSVKLAQEQGSLRAVYNDWPVSETNQSSRVEFHPVPEPASLLMIGLGIFGLAMLSRLQQNRI